MTPNIPDNTTAGVPAADTAPHITVEGFDSPVPEIVELAAPRDGVPLVIETQSGLERCAAAIAAGTGPARWVWGLHSYADAHPHTLRHGRRPRKD